MQAVENIIIFILIQVAISGIVALVSFWFVSVLFDVTFWQLWTGLSVIRINNIKRIE